MTMNDEAVRRLMLAEAHDAMTHENVGAQSPIEIDVTYTPRDRDGIKWAHIRSGGITVLVQSYRKTKKTKPVISILDEGIRTPHDIDTIIALLQRAKSIMEGGA